MEAGSIISIQRRNDIAWSGITRHVQKKKARTIPSAGKIMGTVFWNSEGCILLLDLLPKGETINAARYVDMLKELRSIYTL
jgi:hypothetical protein